MIQSKRHAPATLLSLVFAVVVGLWSSSLAPAQNSQGDYKVGAAKDVDIRVTGVFQEIPPTGHYPLKFTIQNDSGTKFEGRVRVTTSTGHYRYESQFSSDFSISADSKSEAVHVLIVPLPPPHRSGHTGSNLSWSLTHNMAGSSPSRSLGGNIDSSHPAVAYGTEAAVLIQPRIGNSMVRSGHSYGGTNGTRFDTRDLPADARALSGMDMVVLTESDWADVAEASRGAVLDWVRLGGKLVLYPQSGRSFSQLGVKVPEPPEGERSSKVGLGEVTMASSFDPGRLSTIDMTTPAHVMSGNATHYERLTNDYTGSWPAGSKLGKRRFATAQVVIILLLFGILVGPVNLFVWAKPGKRHRLFFTTPLISLAASLLLAGLIAVQDGFGGKGARHTLVLTDPDTNKAYIHQEQASRTGVLLGTSFEPDPEGLAIQLPWGSSGAGGSSSDRQNFRASGGSLSGDWFRSRTDQAQYLQAVEPTRGGVEVSTGGGAPTLVSSFDFPLEDVTYVDAEGNYWRASRADTGAAVDLKRMSREDFAAWCIQQSRRFSDGLEKHLTLDALIHKRGTFFAVSSEPNSLGIETLGSVKWRDSYTFVLGRAVAR